MRNRASREQVDVHNVPIDRVPHVRGEGAPEVTHEIIHLNERGCGSWVQHIRIRRRRRYTGGRNIVQVFCKAPGTVPEVEIFDLREDNRGLDHQDERIGLAHRMSEQDMWIVEPLSFLGEHKHLLSVGGQYIPGSEYLARCLPLAQIGLLAAGEVG